MLVKRACHYRLINLFKMKDSNVTNKRNRYVITAMVSVLLFVIQRFFSNVAGYLSNIFDHSAFDKDDLFISISVHHILQMLFAIALIILLDRVMKIDGFKLRPRYDEKGIRYTLIFCAVLAVYYLIVYFIGSYTKTINTYDYDLDLVNVTGTLGFQLFLSGPSEEILFRSLPIATLLYCMRPDGKKDRITAVVIAALLFGIAHIDFSNFSIPWFQVCYAFVLGLAYGFVFIRTKSVIYPMIMHSVSNVISVGGCYLYMMFFR